MTDDMDLSRSQKRRLKEQRREVNAVLEHEPSRRFLRRMIDVAGVFEPGSQELAARDIGLWVIAELNAASPHAFPRLMMEAANEQTAGEPDAD